MNSNLSIEEVIIAVDEPHNQYCRLGVCSMQSVIANVTRLTAAL
jgi:hypothetical protein